MFPLQGTTTGTVPRQNYEDKASKSLRLKFTEKTHLHVSFFHNKRKSTTFKKLLQDSEHSFF